MRGKDLKALIKIDGSTYRLNDDGTLLTCYLGRSNKNFGAEVPVLYITSITSPLAQTPHFICGVAKLNAIMVGRSAMEVVVGIPTPTFPQFFKDMLEEYGFESIFYPGFGYAFCKRVERGRSGMHMT